MRNLEVEVEEVEAVSGSSCELMVLLIVRLFLRCFNGFWVWVNTDGAWGARGWEMEKWGLIQRACHGNVHSYLRYIGIWRRLSDSWSWFILYYFWEIGLLSDCLAFFTQDTRSRASLSISPIVGTFQ